MELNSQSKTVDRQPVAAGRFYSSDRETLRRDIQKLFADCRKPEGVNHARAIIAPHAGYVFSGRIAASAFSATPRDAGYKNIFLIGSSHVMAFEGASVYNTGDFVTPLGKIHVNRGIADELKKDFKVFDYPTSAHIQDHCLEVQIPLIQYYYTSAPSIVPIIIGTSSSSTIKKIAEALRQYFTGDNLFVISSDFSHYPSYEDGKMVDNATAEALVSGDPSVFLSALRKNSLQNIGGLATSMCGWTAGLTLLELAEGQENLEFRRIDYCNSGDSQYGSKDEVVGYHAIVLDENADKREKRGNEGEEFSFTETEREMLFDIARRSIMSMLYEAKRYSPDESKMTASLKKPYGAFVTLKIDGVLRGCIGRFVTDKPLYRVIGESAISSAFEDPRFPVLTKSEYEKTEVEITVLGPMRKISDIKEIKLGRHGIYIKKDLRAGTMLPQVATEYGWTVEEFLGYTSRDKAGIGWDGWKNAEIFIYEGLVLEEKGK
ncbi:MAG: AmmeMemoRadiSam system protein B [Bacteroidales bacterium]|nr:AmmeMemoRadiSam system protein B [Bacteroidales bacterium]